uniref:Transposase (Putative), gypsy type n=1 Tax=Tanacetum cinerariifolium TaxID=118510 RepID=A0A6L2LL93_TANCI|nr:hypothetical protein [Tanacetum cinerariifolium]
MVRDTIQLDDAVSTISQEYLLEFTSEYGIPESMHPEFPGPEEPIVEFPEGKVGVYTKFFEFANFLIGAAKVSHIEINCRVLNIVQTLNSFRVFYVPSFNSGLISFSKRSGKNTSQCYTKPLDSLKNWNNWFFWLDERVFLTVLEWRTSAPKDQMPSAGSYELVYLISASNPTKIKTGTRPRAAHEVPLLTATANRVIDMEDTVEASESSGTPSTLKKSPLDFANEDPPQMITESGGAEGQVHDELAHGNPSAEDASQKGQKETEANVPPKVLRKDHAAFLPAQGTLGGEFPVLVGLDTGSTVFIIATHDAPTSVIDSDPLSYAKPQPHHERDIAQESGVRKIVLLSLRGRVARGYLSAGVGRNQKLPPGYPKGMSRHGGDGFIAEAKIKNLETLLEAEVDMKKAAEARNAKLAKELESLRVQFADLKVNNTQLSQHVYDLQAQVTSEEKIKSAFEEFKIYEDDKVEQRCAKMDARLDKLSMDFDEERYPHMLTAIARCRLAKGMSEGLKQDIEHGRAGRDLADIKAYDPEADSKYVKALHDLKDLKYPLVDQLKKLRDAPIDVIMASLYLESYYEEDATQWIRELHPSSSHLKIPVYPEVHDPKDLWSFKEEILLEDDIATNISRAKKKKKCQVVCRTHGVSFAHHARSDGVSVSVPTVTPQGLAILLADVATQTEISEDEASSRLLRSKSISSMYNLDWP